MSEVSNNTRRSSRKKERMKKIAITGLIISVISIIATIIVIINCTSYKEELREQGIAEFNSGNYEKAEQLLQESIDEKQWFSKSMDIDSKVYIAESTLKRGDYTKALTLYNELLNSNEYSNKEFLKDRIEFADAMDTFINQKDYSSAAAKLEKLIEKGDSSLNIYLGACYANNGDGDKMQAAFDNYINDYGMNTYVASQLASYYVGIGDDAKASEYIQQGVYSGDDKYMYLLEYNKAVILERQKNYAEAYKIISELHLAYPDNIDFEKEYDFLNSRVNIDETPVNAGEEKHGWDEDE